MVLFKHEEDFWAPEDFEVDEKTGGITDKVKEDSLVKQRRDCSARINAQYTKIIGKVLNM